MLRISPLALMFLLASAPAAAGEAGSFECLIAPHTEVSVASAVPGLVASVEVGRGDSVTKGKVLARLASGVERATYELAKERAAFGKRTVERNRELFEKQLLSPHERDKIETEALLARLEEREARERLLLRTIRSPIDGVVVDVDIEAGEYVHELEIIKLAGIDPLVVEVIVPIESLGDVGIGSRATVLPQAPFDSERETTVTVVDQVVDAATGTVGVRLELKNGDHALPAGLKCSVRFLD